MTSGPPIRSYQAMDYILQLYREVERQQRFVQLYHRVAARTYTVPAEVRLQTRKRFLGHRRSACGRSHLPHLRTAISMSARTRAEECSPRFLASWYKAAFAERRPPPRHYQHHGPLRSLPAHQHEPPNAAALLHARLRGRVRCLLAKAPPSDVTRAAVGQPSAQVVGMEQVCKPSCADVLTRSLLPLMQMILTGETPALEPDILELALEELGSAVLEAAPQLHPLVRAIRVAVRTALQRRHAVDPDDGGAPVKSAVANVVPVSSSDWCDPTKSLLIDEQASRTNVIPADEVAGEIPSGSDCRSCVAASPSILPPLTSPIPVLGAALPTVGEQRAISATEAVAITVASVTHATLPTHQPAEAAVPAAMLRDEDALLLSEMLREEERAAIVLQRCHRNRLCRRALPDIQRKAREMLVTKDAVRKLQAMARSWFERTHKLRVFKRKQAVLCIQRGMRSSLRRRLHKDLLYRGSRLASASIQRAMHVRDAFSRLDRAERLALLPGLLSMYNGTIDTLTQAGDLWVGLQPLGRATAIMDHLRESSAPERAQVLHLAVQTCSYSELLSFLHFIAGNAHRWWNTTRSQIIQSFLSGQSEHIAFTEESRIIDSIVGLLPADAVARSMQRLALFSNLPPVHAMIPKPRQPFERILQVPSPPPRSARSALEDQKGDLFGPSPKTGRALITAKETGPPPLPVGMLGRGAPPPGRTPVASQASLPSEPSVPRPPGVLLDRRYFGPRTSHTSDGSRQTRG